MSINGVRYQGDDPLWKEEVERELAALRRLVTTLTSQVNNLNRG